MANFNGTARSNYFRVKDEAAFRTWCAALGLAIFEGEGKQLGMFGFYSDDSDTGTFPSFRPSRHGEDDDEEIDLGEELAPHLADGEIAVLMEAGAEKLRYISGWAQAIHSDGRMVAISLHDIYSLAEATFGTKPTEASY